MKPIDVTGDLA